MTTTAHSYMIGRNRKAHTGFTLVELLVVIAIIAVLLSIMLPALRTAKEQASQVVCASRLRSVSGGVLLFVTDNDGFLPMADGSTIGSLDAGSDSSNYCYSFRSIYPHRELWYREAARYLDVRDDPYVQQGWKTAEIAGLDAPKIFQCPSMRRTYYNTRGLAFGWNWNGLGYKCKSYFAETEAARKIWAPRRASQIRSASVTGMIGENPLGQDPVIEREALRHYWGGIVAEKYTGGRYGFYWYGDRHRDGSNYIAVDGHNEYKKMSEYIEDYEYYRTNQNESGGIIFPSPRRL